MNRGVGGWVALAVGSLAACVTLGNLIGTDPMLAFELGTTGLALLWAGLAIRELVEARRVAAALSVQARSVMLFDVPCLVTPGLGVDAMAVGFLRPRIFVGAELVGALAEDELRAVIHHEDHHRRTRAPLRAAALAAWVRLFGRSSSVRRVMLARLTDLETLADGDAIRRGSTASAIARALLKGDLSPRPVAFSYAADRRVEHLLDHSAGLPVAADRRLPVEWLPVSLMAGFVLACHIGL